MDGLRKILVHSIFNPDVNTVTLNVYNQYFDITSLKTPQVFISLLVY